jgi:hypothetical protein
MVDVDGFCVRVELAKSIRTWLDGLVDNMIAVKNPEYSS